jgi:hypothetical protein
MRRTGARLALRDQPDTAAAMVLGRPLPDGGTAAVMFRPQQVRQAVHALAEPRSRVWAGRKCQPARTPLVGPHTRRDASRGRVRRAGLFIAHVIGLDSRRPSFVCPLTRAVPQLDEVISGKKPCPVYTTDVKSRQQMSTRDPARTNARVRAPPCPRVSCAPYISGAPLAFPLLSPSGPHSHPHLSFRRARGR